MSEERRQEEYERLYDLVCEWGTGDPRTMSSALNNLNDEEKRSLRCFQEFEMPIGTRYEKQYEIRETEDIAVHFTEKSDLQGEHACDIYTGSLGESKTILEQKREKFFQEFPFVAKEGTFFEGCDTRRDVEEKINERFPTIATFVYVLEATRGRMYATRERAQKILPSSEMLPKKKKETVKKKVFRSNLEHQGFALHLANKFLRLFRGFTELFHFYKIELDLHHSETREGKSPNALDRSVRKIRLPSAFSLNIHSEFYNAQGLITSESYDGVHDVYTTGYGRVYTIGRDVSINPNNLLDMKSSEEDKRKKEEKRLSDYKRAISFTETMLLRKKIEIEAGQKVKEILSSSFRDPYLGGGYEYLKQRAEGIPVNRPYLSLEEQIILFTRDGILRQHANGCPDLKNCTDQQKEQIFLEKTKILLNNPKALEIGGLFDRVYASEFYMMSSSHLGQRKLGKGEQNFRIRNTYRLHSYDDCIQKSKPNLPHIYRRSIFHILNIYFVEETGLILQLFRLGGISAIKNMIKLFVSTLHYWNTFDHIQDHLCADLQGLYRYEMLTLFYSWLRAEIKSYYHLSDQEELEALIEEYEQVLF